MFDILSGIKNRLTSNNISPPIFYEYENPTEEAIFIFNTNNSESKSAQQITYLNRADVTIISRFIKQKDSLTTSKSIHELFTDFQGVLTDENGSQGVVQWVNVISAPRFIAVNKNQDSKEYAVQYQINYLKKLTN